MLGQRLLAAFNLSPEPASVSLPGIHVGARTSAATGFPREVFASATLRLPGHGVAFFELTAP